MTARIVILQCSNYVGIRGKFTNKGLKITIHIPQASKWEAHCSNLFRVSIFFLWVQAMFAIDSIDDGRDKVGIIKIAKLYDRFTCV